MADFKTHICVSTVAGIFYGVGGFQAGLPWESCTIGTALCSVSGMLPDLDSDSGIPLRVAVAFSSAFVPMLMVDRLQRIGCSHETMLTLQWLFTFFCDSDWQKFSDDTRYTEACGIVYRRACRQLCLHSLFAPVRT